MGAASRVGRGSDQGMSLDLVAPLRGVGMTASAQPTLYYIVSEPIAQPMRLVISARGQVRPLADKRIPKARRAGLQALPLRQLGLQLAPEVLYVWSVEVTLDPQSPSNDVVASALLLYRPRDPALDQALNRALVRDRPRMLAEAGYLYDAIATAEAFPDADRWATLAGSSSKSN